MTASLIRTFVLSSALLLPAGGQLAAQTLHTAKGEVLIGRVVSVDDTSVKIELGYPAAGERTVARADLLPVSVYDAMAAITPPKTAARWKNLGDAAMAMRLPAQALASYRRFGALGGKAEALTRLEKKVQTECATVLMKHVRAADKAGDLGRAHLLATLIASEFSDLPQAANATKSAEQIAGRVVKRLAGAEAPADKVGKASQAATKLLGQAQAALEGEADQAAHYEAASALTTAWSRVAGMSNAGEVRDQVRAALIAEHAALAQKALRAHSADAVMAHAGAIRALDPSDPRAAQLGAAALQVWMTTGFPTAD